MENLYQMRNIMCIDLKSFFASCECVERGIDGFKVPLVVANASQGNGAITLAITPFLKAKGIKSRTRLYDIPPYVKYQIVSPRMNLYMNYSKKVIDVYLKFVASDDILVYSIDECFLDVTDYLKMYKKTDYELAEKILNTIYKTTGLTANCGIGPNMLLAKIAMDNEAKKYKNGIVKWTYDDVQKKLWQITPLSKIWGIGPQMEKKLNNLSIFSLEDIVKKDLFFLKKKFGIMGEELWYHAHGIDNSRIMDYKLIAVDKSFSHSQVLFKDYNEENIKIIILEMIDLLCIKLRKNNKECNIIGLGIGYSKAYGDGFYHCIKIPGTDNNQKLLEYEMMLFDKYYDFLPIRKVTISFAGLKDKEGLQLNLFDDIIGTLKDETINNVIDNIKDKYGKNSLIKASSLLDDSTAIERNVKIGGHHI